MACPSRGRGGVLSTVGPGTAGGGMAPAASPCRARRGAAAFLLGFVALPGSATLGPRLKYKINISLILFTLNLITFPINLIINNKKT